MPLSSVRQVVILLTEGSGSQPTAQGNGRRPCLLKGVSCSTDGSPEFTGSSKERAPRRWTLSLQPALLQDTTLVVRLLAQPTSQGVCSCPLLLGTWEVEWLRPAQETGDAGEGGDGGKEEGAKGEWKAEKVHQERRDGRPSLTQEEGGVRKRRKAPKMMRRRGGSEAAQPHFPCKSLSSTSSFRRLWVRREGTG